MLIALDKEKVIMQPLDIVELLQTWLEDLDEVDREKEHFIAIHLNTRSKVKQVEVVSIGIVNSAIVHPREVFRRAIIEASSQLIIAHNHPSGDCSPSDEDITITKRLKTSGEIIGINLLDHIVFSTGSYYSLSQHGDI